MPANQNVTQLAAQTGSADPTSLLYAVKGGVTDTSLPWNVLVNNMGLTGVPTAPTAANGTNTTQIATTAFVTNQISTGSFTQTATGNFYQNLGARVNRLNDRLFVGGATLNNATNVASQPDWLTTYQIAKGRTYGYIQTSQFAALNVQASQDSLTTVVVGAQTAGRSTSGSEVIAVTGMGINNDSGNTGSSLNAAWGGYFEAFRDTGSNGNGGAYGVEIDTMNFTSSTPVTDPYGQGNDQIVGLQLASGGGFGGTLYPTTVGLNFQNNNTTYDKGIVFGSNSITGATGSSGTGTAIALGNGHTLQWYGAASTPTSSILCQGTTTAGQFSQVFNNGQVQWLNTGGNPVFSIINTTSAVNYLQVVSNTTTNIPALQAQGSDTNVGMLFAPKGTGSVQITSTAASGLAFVISATSNTSTGATIQLQGNGATTPNKYIRAFGGNLQVVNSADTTVILGLDDSGDLSVTGSLTTSQTAGIIGTTTNNNANAGSVGENVNASFSAVAMSNGVNTNLGSISLTAGDWEVYSHALYTSSAGTTWTAALLGTSSTSATLPAAGLYAQNSLTFSAAASPTWSTIAPQQRFSLSATTTIYAVGLLLFSAGTITATGFIRARRIR